MRIPKVFRASDTGKPHDHCLVCNKFLLGDGTTYLIEKAIRQYPEQIKDTIFEYAICTDCMLMFHESLSSESRQRIEQYFLKNCDLISRRENLLSQKTRRVQSWLARCVVKGTPIVHSSEYQIVAQCDGKHMLFTYMPYAISSTAMDEMTDLLSEKSLGEIDDFTGKYFSGPPEIAELIRKRSIMPV
jgi:hypothetical protein